ncbi:hypothetical protein DSM104329_02973 [Capillimicrobium parvum]|uniref:Uncharacterized protein n=1 Tax=Capillimicrobium parvum TaxID=2884022 RepID=A0A9E6XY89_9ACTN|nr:hypothetical protein DSM104329_02973 [Capillimicrobium parvum]
MRDPAHVLFDHACDLLAAAQGLRAAAPVDGIAPALAATLGCLEATLDALAAAVADLGEDAVRQLEDGPWAPGDAWPSAVAAERQFAGLVDILSAGEAMAGSLRERLGAAGAAARAS